MTLRIKADNYSGTCGDNLKWKLDTVTGVLTISGTGRMDIDNGYEDHANSPWFDYSHIIKSVIINDGVVTIGGDAFYYCTNLSKVTIPDSVAIIENGAFNGCSSLTSVTIPDSVEYIGDFAFYGCSILTNVTISDSVKLIGEDTFARCTSLKKVIFKGDAPDTYIMYPINPIEINNPYADRYSVEGTVANFTIYYFKEKSGWATPTWTSTEGRIYNTVEITDEPEVSDEKADAIIFIPGILGSEIYAAEEVNSNDYLKINNFKYAENHKFWAPLESVGALEKLVGLCMLSCDVNGIPTAPTKAEDLDKTDDLYGTMDTYGTIMKNLHDNFDDKFSKENIRFFAYDWRLSISDSAKKLEDTINKNGYNNVILIAHSMGGLVASDYIVKIENADKINKLITLGTPYLGAPKAAYVFGTGQMFDGSVNVNSIIDSYKAWAKDLVLQKIFKTMSQNIISQYELLPPEQYFSMNKIGYLINKGPEVFSFHPLEKEIKSYSETSEMIDLLWGRERQFQTNAQKIYDNLLSNNKHITSTVDSYYVIGTGEGTIEKLTIDLYPNNDTTLYDLYDYTLIPDDDYTLISDVTSDKKGDGTVPVISANIGNTTPRERTFYIEADHTDLVKNVYIFDLINSIIGNKKEEPLNVEYVYDKDIIKHDLPEISYNFAKRVEIACPVDVNIYKDNILVASFTDNNITFENNDVISCYTAGKDNDKKIAYLTSDDLYDIKITGTDNGFMDYTLQEIGFDGEIVRSISFENVNINPSTIISADTDTDKDIIINIDDNGDGIRDQQLSPKYDYDTKTDLNVVLFAYTGLWLMVVIVIVFGLKTMHR